MKLILTTIGYEIRAETIQDIAWIERQLDYLSDADEKHLSKVDDNLIQMRVAGIQNEKDLPSNADDWDKLNPPVDWAYVGDWFERGLGGILAPIRLEVSFSI